MRTALVLLLAASSLVAAPVPKALKKATDAQLLEGCWQFVTRDDGGGHKPTDGHMVVSGGKMDMDSVGPVPTADHPFTLDATTTPKRLDVAWKDWGSPQQYIYHLDGDTLTICHAQPNQPRPVVFNGGDGKHCFVLTRVKE